MKWKVTPSGVMPFLFFPRIQGDHKTVSFGAIAKPDALHRASPQIAFSGRSNVGKSSLINRSAEPGSCRAGFSTPGKTQEINFYEVVAERRRSCASIWSTSPDTAEGVEGAASRWKPLIEGISRHQELVALCSSSTRGTERRGGPADDRLPRDDRTAESLRVDQGR